MTRMACARGHIQVDQFLDRQAISQVVADRIHIIQPVGHHFGLLVGLGFHVLFDAGVQETDVGDTVDHGLAVQFEQQAQHAVRGGMLRPHVQQHGLALDGPVGDQVLQIVYGDFLNIRHKRLASSFPHELPYVILFTASQVDLFKVEGELRFLVAQRIILAQRVAFPVGGHQDAAQVGMTLELDAEHVPQFALTPVGATIEVRNSWQGWVDARDRHAQFQNAGSWRPR